MEPAEGRVALVAEVLSTATLSSIAKAEGFDLVGFARAEPIPRSILGDWIAAGYHADLDWMSNRVEELLDVDKLFPGAKTVMAMATNYWHTDAPSPIARYARTRDYHFSIRERLRRVRRNVRAAFSDVDDYGSVDANPVMEKVWAVRAGLGSVGKNGCFITKEHGSWVLLSALILNREVDAYASWVDADVCGRCTLCLTSCPTAAIVSDRVVDARLCLSYQTIENDQHVPASLRSAMQNVVFGCDICQEVCPLNATPVRGSERFAPRPIGSVTARQLAAMSRQEYAQWVPGTPLARAQFEGVKRNAAYALGAMKDDGARSILEALVRDEPDERIQEAARWALQQLTT